jgi:hypothetical protein
MEIILLGITLGSLLVALVAGIVAWRSARNERARSAARVAALAAAAAEPARGLDESVADAPSAAPAQVIPESPVARAVPQPVVSEPVPEVVTIEPRTPWTPARVSTFIPARTVAAGAERIPDLALNTSAHEIPSRPATAPIADSFLETEAPRASEGRQRGLAMAAAIFFVVLAGGAYWLISGPNGGAQATSASGAAVNAPLELMSLRHERVGTRLSLSGLVRNPAAGAPIDSLNAVVFLFDAQGGFITSARTGVDFKRLAPGDESPFVITMDAPANVARYRVSFRTEAGILAHVDRRSEQPAATAIAGSKS